jgi:hypothetical protein
VVRRVDHSSDGGVALLCDGVSELVRDRSAWFLTELEEGVRVLMTSGESAAQVEKALTRNAAQAQEAGEEWWMEMFQQVESELPPPQEAVRQDNDEKRRGKKPCFWAGKKDILISGSPWWGIFETSLLRLPRNSWVR